MPSAQRAGSRHWTGLEMVNDWVLEGALKDGQTVGSDWTATSNDLIDGVRVHEMRNVPKRGGYLTEILRGEWLGDNGTVDQIFQSVLEGGTVTAWHAHARTTDRLFVSHGTAKIVLYDARSGSTTRGTINEFRFGTVRPALLVVPPRVWHGVRAEGPGPAILLNIVDVAYDYADPDHWRVARDSSAIPYDFSS